MSRLTAVIGIECDIWIPAARPDVVREDNIARLKTKLVLQGANIPFSAGAEQSPHDRGVLVVPDFIANAGGVICAAMDIREQPNRRRSRLSRRASARTSRPC